MGGNGIMLNNGLTPHPESLNRAKLFSEMVAFYAAALEYPEEVFSEGIELEAELGIDSVKQTELLARVTEKYGLPPRPADFRLSDYRTMGRIVDFIASAAPANSAVPPIESIEPSASPSSKPARPSRAEVMRDLVI